MCPICQQNLTIGDTTTLACTHQFDRECIAGWIGQGKYTCPVCRADSIPHTLTNVQIFSGTTHTASATAGTFTLDFTTITMPTIQVIATPPTDNGQYDVTVDTIGGVTPNNPYQLPTMTFDPATADVTQGLTLFKL